MRGRLQAILATTVLLASFQLVGGGQSSDIQYVYDATGRLIAVIDATGDTAVYSYDAVGNLLSIARLGTTDAAVIDFAPASGPIGTVVTIYGTGFSTTPEQNSIEFDGTAADVSSATPNILVTTVPEGATSGSVTVIAPNGTAVSAHPFVVTDTGPPSITDISPEIGTPGTTVTLTGMNFTTTSSHNLVALNLTAAQVTSAAETSVEASVPAATASGRIRITTPLGSATSEDDFFIPPHPYGVGDVEFTGRTSFGEPLAVPITTAQNIGLVVFDAIAGHRTSVRISSGPLGTVSLLKPDGTVQASESIGVTIRLIEPQIVQQTGTYSLLVDPLGSATGTTTVTPFDVPPDVTGTIEPGGRSGRRRDHDAGPECLSDLLRDGGTAHQPPDWARVELRGVDLQA